MKKTFCFLTILLIPIIFHLESQPLFAGSLLEDGETVPSDPHVEKGYMIDLKRLINKSKTNIERVNKRLQEQAVKRRNVKREQQAREHYEKAVELFEKGEYETARIEWEKAIRITEHPEMRYYINESIQRFEQQEEALVKEKKDRERRINDDRKDLMIVAEEGYQRAVALYKQKKFSEAKSEFELINEMFPGYKATLSYLRIIKQDIIEQKEVTRRQRELELERQTREEEMARVEEKERWRKELEEKEVAKEKEVRQQAELVYSEAVRLYKERKFELAKEKFEEVGWVLPDYKNTTTYLDRVDKDIEVENKRLEKERKKSLERQKWQEEIEKRKMQEQLKSDQIENLKEEAVAVYKVAVDLFNKELYKDAQEKFAEADRLSPGIKDVKGYFVRIDRLLTEEQRLLVLEEGREVKRKEDQKLREVELKADRIYEQAKDAHKYGKFEEAKKKFKEVENFMPGFKEARNYLANIKKEEEKRKQFQKQLEMANKAREERVHLHTLMGQIHEISGDIAEVSDSLETQQFQQVKKIFEEMKNQQEEVIREQERQEVFLRQEAEEYKYKELNDRADSLYNEALKFCEMKEFRQAKVNFEKVMQLLPAYKETNYYLGRIDKDIENEDARREKEDWLARRKEREARIKALFHEEEKKLQELTVNANNVYSEVMQLTEQKKFDLANEKLSEVQKMFKQIKAEKLSLEERRKEEKEKLKRDFGATLKEEKKKKINKADKKALRVELVDKGGARKVKRVSEVEQKEKLAEKEDALFDESMSPKERKKFLSDTKKLYVKGVKSFNAKQYLTARETFLAIEKLIPNYKLTNRYLERIEVRVEEDRHAAALNASKKKVVEKAEEASKGKEPSKKAAKMKQKYDKKKVDFTQDVEEKEARILLAEEKALEDKRKQERLIARKELMREKLSKKKEERTIALERKREESNRKRIEVEQKREQRKLEKLKKMKDAQVVREKRKEKKRLMLKKKEDDARLKEAMRKEQIEKERARLKKKDEYLRKRSIKIKKRQQDKLDFSEVKDEKVFLKEKKKQQYREDKKESVEKRRRDKYLAKRSKNKSRLKTSKEKAAKRRSGAVKQFESIPDVDAKITTLENQGGTIESQQAAIRRELMKEVGKMYNEAIGLYKRGHLDDAKQRFSDIEDVSVNYKKTKEYLNIIQSDLDKKHKKKKVKSKRKSKRKKREKKKVVEKEKSPAPTTNFTTRSAVEPDSSLPLKTRKDFISDYLDHIEVE